MDIPPFNLLPKYPIGKAFSRRFFGVFGVVKLNESPIERDICHGFRPVFLGKRCRLKCCSATYSLTYIVDFAVSRKGAGTLSQRRYGRQGGQGAFHHRRHRARGQMTDRGVSFQEITPLWGNPC